MIVSCSCVYKNESGGRREIGLHCSSLLVNPRRRHLPSSTALACFLLHSANKKAMLHITKSGPFFSRAAQIDLMKKNILIIYIRVALECALWNSVPFCCQWIYSNLQPRPFPLIRSLPLPSPHFVAQHAPYSFCVLLRAN